MNNASSRQRALDWLQQHRALVDDGMDAFNPFASSAWRQHFVAQVVDDRAMEAVLVHAEHDGQPVLMPLSRDPARPWWLRGLSNYYSSLDSVLHTRAADRDGAARAALRQLRSDQPRCAVLQLAPLDAQSAATNALRRALHAEGWYTKTYFCFGNWTFPCEGLGFAEYMKARDSQLYNTWSRKAKKFKADGSGEARLHIAVRPDEVDAAMDAYEAVYAKSWKQPEPYPDFVRGWAHVCAREGWLRLGLTWVGDVAIAAQFWFTVGRRAYIFKLAYDEDYAKWSAGTVLTAHLMRHALDTDRVVEVDYLTGDDAYKKSWMSERRERIGLLACRLGSTHGLAVAAREVAASAARRWIPRREREMPAHPPNT